MLISAFAHIILLCNLSLLGETSNSFKILLVCVESETTLGVSREFKTGWGCYEGRENGRENTGYEGGKRKNGISWRAAYTDTLERTEVCRPAPATELYRHPRSQS